MVNFLQDGVKNVAYEGKECPEESTAAAERHWEMGDKRDKRPWLQLEGT